MPRNCLALALILGFSAFVPVVADDWPQWMGPQRDNVWRETGLVDQFPESGPRVAWRSPVSHGYAGPAVAKGRVYVTEFITTDDVKVDNFARAPKTGEERVQCLDQATGDIVWSYSWPATYAISYPNGPRCTPLVSDGKLYVLGAVGNLYCFDAAQGDVLWSKNFQADYGVEAPLWGFSAHPLVDGEKLICVIGGEGSHAVAFNKDTGEEIWRALSSQDPGYSPPTIIEHGGVRLLVLLRPDAVSAVDPDTGAELWSAPYNADNGCIIMSPVLSGDHLYVGGHMNKSLLLKLTSSPPGAEVVWHDKGRDAISPVNVQPLVEGGVMYGVDQRGMLRAIDLAEGKQLWETPQPTGERPLSSGTAFLVKQGDRYWFFTEAGDLVIARLTPEGYEEIDRARVIEPTSVANGRDVLWSMPAFAGRRAFIRNDKEIIAVDLAADSGPAANP